MAGNAGGAAAICSPWTSSLSASRRLRRTLLRVSPLLSLCATLAAHFITDADERVQATDEPERHQVLFAGRPAVVPNELVKEAAPLKPGMVVRVGKGACFRNVAEPGQVVHRGHG